MKLHHTRLTTAAIVGVLSAGGAMATAASSSATTPAGGSTTQAAAANSAGHVSLTTLVTGKGKHAHLVVRERGAIAGGGTWLGDYQLEMDGHVVDWGTGSANCPNKPVQSFDVTRRAAPIHLVAGRHVVKITQYYCKTRSAAKYVPATHTVAFTAH
jgi:hypothetical protein